MKDKIITITPEQIINAQSVHNSFGNTICKVLFTSENEPIISIVERHCKTTFLIDRTGRIYYLLQE